MKYAFCLLKEINKVVWVWYFLEYLSGRDKFCAQGRLPESQMPFPWLRDCTCLRGVLVVPDSTEA